MKALRRGEAWSGAAGGQAGHEEPTRREELLRTAVDLFARYGYTGTSIRDIANAAGMSVSNIYHYFGNKEGLWLAILEYSINGLPDRLNAVWQSDLDPVERFRLLVKTHLSASKSHQKETRMFFIDQGEVSHRGNSRNKAIQTQILDIYVQAMDELRAAGYVHTREVKILAFNVLGVISWYLRWYRADGRLPAEKVHEEIANFVLHGVLGPAE
ncbi:MAG: TetR/AcrR family transcriptional regulator [Betaproteobacteria bacterium]|nr:TetR/AcrR family transcriptional regulator [Betaproteobacteria bacterium]